MIVRLYTWLLRPFFWTTRLGRQYTAIIGWGLQWMFGGDLSRDNCIAAFCAHHGLHNCHSPGRPPAAVAAPGWVGAAGKVIACPALVARRNPLVIDRLSYALCHACRFLEVPMPEAPFPPPQNEGSKEMLKQLGTFITPPSSSLCGDLCVQSQGALDL